MMPPEWYALLVNADQPGDHLAKSKPHRALARVVAPHTARVTRPRRMFMRYVILPVVAVAVLLAIILLADIGVL